jgi:cytochrome b561
MVDLSYYSEWYKVAPYWHKSIGIILLALTLFRVLWKMLNKAPEIEGLAWEKSAAKIAHLLLYILLFSTFISGYLISTADGRGIEVFNWFTLPALGSLIENQEDIAGEGHFYLTYSLIGLALLHALAALKHHFINKDNTLKKII